MCCNLQARKFMFITEYHLCAASETKNRSVAMPYTVIEKCMLLETLGILNF